MGLDTSHSCWHGAYSAFNRWRNKIAEVAGYEMAEYDGIPAPKMDWDNISLENVNGKWSKLPSDPLVILFAHSDCDGYIQWRSTKPLADRLTELLPLLDGDGGGHIGSYRSTTQAFIDGLLLAHSKNERVEFH